MPASGSIASASYLDSVAANATATINGKDLGPHSRVTFIRLSVGRQPSYALIHIPLVVLDDVAPSIAGIASGPVTGTRHWNPAIVSAQMNPSAGTSDPTTTILSGVVTEIDSTIEQDYATITIEDWRFMMEGVMILGSFWGQWNNTTAAYREGVKPHFNANNQPNAIFVSAVGAGGTSNYIPMFCTPNYGINDTIVNSLNIPDPSTIPQNKATWWTPRMKMDYLIFAATQTNTVGTKFPFYKNAATQIHIPNGLSAMLDDTSQTTGNRKCTECVWHCHSWMAAFEDICHESGAFEPCIQSNDDGSGTLSIVRMHYEGADGSNTPSATSDKGTTLVRATSGKAQNVLTQGGNINAGNLRESSKRCFSLCASSGAHPFIEMRFHSDVGNTNAAPLNRVFNGILDDAKKAFETSLNANGPNGPQPSMSAALESIFSQYPQLFSDYIVNPSFDFQAGTGTAENGPQGFPLAQVGRPPLPHLISSFIAAAASGVLDTFALVNSRRPIPTEWSIDGADANWNQMAQPDGLEIIGDGTITFRHKRDLLASQGLLSNELWNIVIDPSSTYPNLKVTTFQATAIRINLAMPCDHRLTQAIRTSADPTKNVVVATPGGTAADIGSFFDDSDRFDPTMSRLLAVDTGALHAYEERNNSDTSHQSFPIPNSLQYLGAGAESAPVPFPAANTDALSVTLFGDAKVLRDDTKECFNHALRGIKKVGRLDRGGAVMSPHIILTFQPGMYIDSLLSSSGPSYPVKASVHSIELNFDKPQSTRLILV